MTQVNSRRQPVKVYQTTTHYTVRVSRKEPPKWSLNEFKKHSAQAAHLLAIIVHWHQPL